MSTTPESLSLDKIVEKLTDEEFAEVLDDMATESYRLGDIDHARHLREAARRIRASS